MEGEIIVRKTEKRDIPEIQDILNEAILNTNAYLSSVQKSLEDMKAWFEEHNTANSYFSLSAEMQGNVVGWASISAFRSIDGFAPTAELSVYIQKDYRRLGIAKKLMESVISEAKKRNFQNLISFITIDNEISIQLHQKMDFKIQGELKQIAWKNGKFHDVVILVKTL